MDHAFIIVRSDYLMKHSIARLLKMFLRR